MKTTCSFFLHGLLHPFAQAKELVQTEGWCGGDLKQALTPMRRMRICFCHLLFVSHLFAQAKELVRTKGWGGGDLN